MAGAPAHQDRAAYSDGDVVFLGRGLLSVMLAVANVAIVAGA
jgi:hypothetical protein